MAKQFEKREYLEVLLLSRPVTVILRMLCVVTLFAAILQGIGSILVIYLMIVKQFATIDLILLCILSLWAVYATIRVVRRAWTPQSTKTIKRLSFCTSAWAFYFIAFIVPQQIDPKVNGVVGIMVGAVIGTLIYRVLRFHLIPKNPIFRLQEARESMNRTKTLNERVRTDRSGFILTTVEHITRSGIGYGAFFFFLGIGLLIWGYIFQSGSNGRSSGYIMVLAGFGVIFFAFGAAIFATAVRKFNGFGGTSMNQNDNPRE